MIRRRWVMSTRVYLVLGLCSLMCCLVLASGLLGLVPDGQALVREQRVALAEALAIGAGTALGDGEDASTAARLLAAVATRHPDLRSIGLRGQDGGLWVDHGDHAGRWQATASGEPADGQLIVPVHRDGLPWGQLELGFEPQRRAGWQGWLDHPQARLLAFLALGGFVSFGFYLRRMLRHLDPAKVIPGRVRSALDTMTEGLMLIDRGGFVVLANLSLARALGRTPDELIGQPAAGLPWRDEAGRPLAEAQLPWLPTLRQAEAQHDRPLQLEGVDGLAVLRANCTPILGAKGRSQGVLVSLQDITELQRNKEALAAARDAAEAANQAKSAFLANMSHEIRTPMNAVLGFTQVLRRSARAGSAEARHLQTIYGSGQHLLALINDILDLSKVEAGRLDVERIALRPHELAGEVLRVMQMKAAEKDLALDIEAPGRLPETVQGDPGRLRQVLTNLVGNAIKFTERGGVTLRLAAEVADGRLRYRLAVADTGIGIAADKLASVFEPFTQAESSTTRRFGGTGLGLTISRAFALAMGGDIVVASTPGAGSVFELAFDAGPAEGLRWLEPAEALAAMTAPEAAPLSAAAWRFPPRHVLVVDDGQENRELVRVLLEETGLVVSEAGDGEQALERVARGDVDLVLMDMQMPRMDGTTATRRLREGGARLPVLALTANAMKGFERELEAAGFSGFLTKPIDADLLLATLAQWLGGEATAPDAVADAGGTAGTARTAGTAGTAGTTDAVVGATPPFAPPATAVDLPQAAAPVAAPAASLAAPAASMPPEAAAAPLVSRLSRHPKLKRVVNRFVDQLPHRLQAMREALDAGRFDTLAAEAHWLKGAGGSIGFDDFFEPAAALERGALESDAVAARACITTLGALGARVQRADDTSAPAPGRTRDDIPLETTA